jgi:hypothetical protein
MADLLKKIKAIINGLRGGQMVVELITKEALAHLREDFGW